MQFLADEGKGPRPTGNLCTPGTHVQMAGQLFTKHIAQSSSPTFPASEWVRAEMEVRGHDEIIHDPLTLMQFRALSWIFDHSDRIMEKRRRIQTSRKRSDDEIFHRINGVEVLRYQRPVLDPACSIAPAGDLTAAGAGLKLGFGHIALQAEGQPVWFRKIELLPLEK